MDGIDEWRVYEGYRLTAALFVSLLTLHFHDAIGGSLTWNLDHCPCGSC